MAYSFTYITKRGRALTWESDSIDGEPKPQDILDAIAEDAIPSMSAIPGVGDERETHEAAYDHSALVSASHSHTNKAEIDLVTDGDHDVRVDNPHSVTKAQVGLTDVPDLDTTSAVANDHTHSNKTELDLVTDGDHDVIASGNPHSVTKSEVGLGNVPNLDTTDAVNKAHDQETDKYLATDVTTTLHVDGNRVDSYTANGSITKPYKTITAACTAADSIVGNKNIVIAPGQYDESGIDVPRGCNLMGAGTSELVKISAPVSTADMYVIRVVEGSGNEGTFDSFSADCIWFDGANLPKASGDVTTVDLSALTNGTGSLGMLSYCNFSGPGPNASNTVKLLDIGTKGRISIEHGGFYANTGISIDVGSGGWCEVRDNTWLLAPDGTGVVAIVKSSGTFQTMDCWYGGWSATQDCDLIQSAAGALYVRTCQLQHTGTPTTANKALVKVASGVNLTLAGDGGIMNNICQAPSNGYNFDIAGAGSMKFAQNSYDPAKANIARTIDADMPCEQVEYTPTTSGDWSSVPDDIKSALDELASRVKALEP